MCFYFFQGNTKFFLFSKSYAYFFSNRRRILVLYIQDETTRSHAFRLGLWLCWPGPTTVLKVAVQYFFLILWLDSLLALPTIVVQRLLLIPIFPAPPLREDPLPRAAWSNRYQHTWAVWYGRPRVKHFMHTHLLVHYNTITCKTQQNIKRSFHITTFTGQFLRYQSEIVMGLSSISLVRNP